MHVWETGSPASREFRGVEWYLLLTFVCVCTDAGTGLGDGIASRDFLCDSPPPTLRERGANNKLQCLFQNAKYK